MSGPVFVLDGRGQPLMPVAQAHARKLLQSGRAYSRSHHAFTVIQLTKVVDQPALRPVLLGITVHSQTTELFLLADGTRQVFRLLRLLVDVPNKPWKKDRLPYSHRHRISYNRWVNLKRSTFRGLFPTLRRRARIIQQVIDELRKLIPISHIFILPSGLDTLNRTEKSPQLNSLPKWIGRLLKRTMARVGIIIALPERLRDSFRAFVASPLSHTEVLIARMNSRHISKTARQHVYLKSPATFRRVSRHLLRGLIITYYPDRRIVQSIETAVNVPRDRAQIVLSGTLCEGYRNGRKIVGIAGPTATSRRLSLLIPYITSQLIIRWERVIINPHSHLRLLSNDIILFLPGQIGVQRSSNID